MPVVDRGRVNRCINQVARAVTRAIGKRGKKELNYQKNLLQLRLDRAQLHLEVVDTSVQIQYCSSHLFLNGVPLRLKGTTKQRGEGSRKKTFRI